MFFVAIGVVSIGVLDFKVRYRFGLVSRIVRAASVVERFETTEAKRIKIEIETEVAAAHRIYEEARY
ncbi:MAG: hypothetical protein EOP06_18810 [Proteobacteria bacterium]|nr:MAG: hypothetical protein EOP06_18810 [Pseudomonadota bacterium]